MKAIIHIIRKEFIQLRRDPRMFPIIFVAPLFQLLILGYAVNLDIRNISLAVCDQDNSRQSRELLSQFTNSGYFQIAARPQTINQVDRAMDHGRASMAIVIPEKFGSKLNARKPVQVQVIVDGSEALQTSAGIQYASIILNRYIQNLALQRLEQMKDLGLKLPQLNAELRIWYNPDLKSRNFMVPGVLATLLMILTALLTSLAIVKEKEVGTMEQLMVTPIRPYALIIGKLAPFVLIGTIDVILAMLVAVYWFKVPIQGSLLLLSLVCLVFLMTTLGLGLFISTISRTQQQAMMTAAFFVIMPMIYLSGFAFPIENMPRLIQYFTYLLPLRYFIIIIRGLFLKGVGWHELGTQVLTLAIFGAAILTVSIIRFRKKIG